MATITIKDIPARLHRALRRSAKAHGRSLNREVIQLLDAALLPRAIAPEDLLADLRRVRATAPSKLDERLLRQARTTGRP